MYETVGIGTVKTGFFHTVGAKTALLLASPVVGWVALAGVVGWELWKARQGDNKLKAKPAVA